MARKKKKPVKRSNEIYWFYEEKFISEHREGGDGPYEGYTTTVQEYIPRGIQLNNPEGGDYGPYWNRVELSFKPEIGNRYYCVVVHYSDGSTGGRTEGYGYLEGVYETPEEALDIRDKIKANKYEKDGYKPWMGYFSGLESVDVHSFELVDKLGIAGGIIHH